MIAALTVIVWAAAVVVVGLVLTVIVGAVLGLVWWIRGDKPSPAEVEPPINLGPRRRPQPRLGDRR